MRTLLLAASAFVTLQASAGIIFHSQARETTAFASIVTETGQQTHSAPGLGPWDVTADALAVFNADPGPVSSRARARMISDTTPEAISISGSYVLEPGFYFGTGTATGRSFMSIVFSVNEASPFNLSGLLPGLPFDEPFDPTPRRINLAGPGTDITAPWGEFDIDGVLQPGTYTYTVDVLSRVPGPAGDTSPGFAISEFDATLTVLPGPGTFAALVVTGGFAMSRRRESRLLRGRDQR
ncbi:MAG: hypothetical protein IT433_13170 [Phycisphaerales bacterium]|nr:hypothetical protein [Phycisphaerales bacterium]